MAVTPAVLRQIPLFQDITDDHLQALIGAFERIQVGAGEVLFTAGAEPKHLLLLVSGEVSLEQDGATRFRIAPVAPIGELGAVTGLRRNTTAMVTQPSEIWRLGVANLLAFFEAHGDIAFPLYHNLLKIVGDKVRHDFARGEEMRENLIRTQRAMKQLVARVLEAEETPISRAVCETLEDLIEHNKRGHYMVTPAYALSSYVKLDDGSRLPVLAMSDGWIRMVRSPAPSKGPGSTWSGVLVTPSSEIPISGTIDSSDEDGTLVRLDLLIDDYASTLREYLTRVQMLDFVV